MRNLGIFLWSNRILYSYVSLKPINKDDIIPQVGLPSSSTEVEKVEEDDDVLAAEPDYISPDQLDENLITMSAVAQSRWQNLLDIDIIKKRNKPRQPPKAPETAPFFLPTISSLDMQFDFSEVNTTENTKTLRVHPALQNLTLFGRSLRFSTSNNSFSDVIGKLKAMGPSAIDFEIQSLSLDESCSELLMLQFMKTLHYMMEQQTDFELSQAYLALFLKRHGEVISETEVLRDYLRTLQTAQVKNWHTLREKLFYNLSVVKSCKKL